MQQRRGIKNLQPINPGSLMYQKNQEKKLFSWNKITDRIDIK